MTLFSDTLVTEHRPLRISAAFRSLPPPVILIGMHRSGTSLAAGMLARLGVYLDPALTPSSQSGICAPDSAMRRNGYGEAEAFRHFNDHLLADAGAAWNHVTPFLEQRERPGFARSGCALLQIATFGSLQRNYLSRCPKGQGAAWGWKDPRNSLTIDYWLRLFPQARVLHVRRNPEKVADSLIRRETEAAASPQAINNEAGAKARLQFLTRYPELAPRVLRRRLNRGLSDYAAPAMPSSRADWLNLCGQYVDSCVRAQDIAANYMEVRYEELLADPEAWAERLARFACVTPSPTILDYAAALVQPPT